MNFKRIRPWQTYGGAFIVDMHHRDYIAEYNGEEDYRKRVSLWRRGNWGATIIRFHERSSAP